MQFAEPWLGGSATLVGIACGVALIAPAQHPARSVSKLEPTAKSCASWPSERAASQLPSADPYQRVFDSLRPKLRHCFGAETRVDLLITVAPDGRVASVSHRPALGTPAARCIADEIARQRFPNSSHTIAIRVPLCR